MAQLSSHYPLTICLTADAKLNVFVCVCVYTGGFSTLFRQARFVAMHFKKAFIYVRLVRDVGLGIKVL